jgi:hypothetical protein
MLTIEELQKNSGYSKEVCSLILAKEFLLEESYNTNHATQKRKQLRELALNLTDMTKGK